MKLLKYLATAGVASRRKAEELIRAGAVTVDGVVVTEPATEVPEGAVVAAEGARVSVERKRYFLVHKPVGVLSTAEDTHDRPIVTDLVGAPERLYPVGRLDADSSGLLLLTNDGELANRLTHPRYEVEKTYRVSARRPLSEADHALLAGGVLLEDGPTLPAQVRQLDDPRDFEITLREGRNRQVRRMLEVLGNRVETLVRLKMGPLELGGLPPGEARELAKAEVAALRG